MSEKFSKSSGTIAIIGKPNVGKSTLMNTILGKKISITSRKPQTTRHRILGIKTTGRTQMVFVDTPGMHQNHKHEMNRVMNRVAQHVLSEADVVLFLMEAMRWDQADDDVLQQLKLIQKPVILVINKVDAIKNKADLLPLMENLSKQFVFANIIPISAKTGEHVDGLEKSLAEFLPHEGELYPAEQITDSSDRFVAAEFVREKLMRALDEEIPYELTVTIELFEMAKKVLRISALIWVSKDSQKSIVIGKNGSVLKSVGTQARIDLENYFEQKVLLKLWVKVKDNWSDDARALKELGYDN